MSSPDRMRFGPKKDNGPNLEINKLGIQEVLVAGNRGPCGGVNMALEAVNQVLELVDGREKVYTNWDIVNNKPIMERLNQQGLQSVDNDWTKVPDGSIVFFSAHGVPPSFYELAKQKNYDLIDATCQLVKVVHNSVKKAEREDKHVIYLGKEGHPETEGVLAEVRPENRTFIDIADVGKRTSFPDRPAVIYSQTTLSSSELENAKKYLRQFPNIHVPNRSDVCYAADNRQDAVEDLVVNKAVDLLIVVGSQHSHNSKELKRKGEAGGKPSFLIDGPAEIKRSWFTKGIKKVGVSSGASVLESNTQEVLGWFRAEGVPITYVDQVVPERDLRFKLPQASIDAIQHRYE